MSDGFMYLQLKSVGGKIHATVVPHGMLEYASLGSRNSRLTDAPFATFQIDAFDRLEVITDNELMQEVFRRFTSKDLLQRLEIHLTARELIDMLLARVDP
jgi:hypothetical protein